MALADITTPTKRHFSIVAGASFSHTISITESSVAIPLTGYSGKAQVRNLAGDLLADFEVDVDQESDVDADGCGEVTISLPSSVTLGITPGTHYWDVFVYIDDDNTHPVMAGRFTVKASVTVLD